jgi:hypothetical protein
MSIDTVTPVVALSVLLLLSLSQQLFLLLLVLLKLLPLQVLLSDVASDVANERSGSNASALSALVLTDAILNPIQ